MTSPLPLDQPDATSPKPKLASEASARLPGWRLWVPLLMQTALIVAIPARDAYTYVTGKTVVLQTAPVDPYELMRGYSQSLGYEISELDRLRQLPGAQWLNELSQGTVYVVLEAPAATLTRPPQPWKPVRLSPSQPKDLSANQVALKGTLNGRQIQYGLETYYMPEDQRQKINADIQKIQQQQRQQQSFVVETKVDGGGNAVPISLWLHDRNYRF